ncbi:DoxX family membrane protein [Flavobacteriaceae bacterium]|nr:DoxX family membrane protein [Flavobacteriaceae bacterium]
MNSKLSMVLRLLLGLVMLVFGLNKFLLFIEMPAPPDDAGAFYGAMAATGYLFSLVAITEIAVGVMLLLDKWSNFALVLIAPVSVNIVLFHIFLDPMGGMVGFLLAIINILLIWDRWDAYKSLFN